MDDGTTESFYMFNAHGDVVHLTNSNTGAITKDYTYDVFGIEENQDSANKNPFRYCGEYFDKETETYYLRARYYSPNTGRFISEDSYWGSENDQLSLNLYIYCANNPVIFWDPSGFNPGDSYMEQYYLYEPDYLQVGDFSGIGAGNPPESITDKLIRYANKVSDNAKESYYDLTLGLDTLYDTAVYYTAKSVVTVINIYEDTMNNVIPTVSYTEATSSEAGCGFGKESEMGKINDTRGNYAQYVSVGDEVVIGSSSSVMHSQSIIFSDIFGFEGEYIKVGGTGGVAIAGVTLDVSWAHNSKNSVINSLHNKPIAITLAAGGSVGSPFNVHASSGEARFIPGTIGNRYDDARNYIWRIATQRINAFNP